jgi:hypothetical protein
VTCDTSTGSWQKSGFGSCTGEGVCTPGSENCNSNCQCNPGYSGDGIICNPDCTSDKILVNGECKTACLATCPSGETRENTINYQEDGNCCKKEEKCADSYTYLGEYKYSGMPKLTKDDTCGTVEDAFACDEEDNRKDTLFECNDIRYGPVKRVQKAKWAIYNNDSLNKMWCRFADSVSPCPASIGKMFSKEMDTNSFPSSSFFNDKTAMAACQMMSGGAASPINRKCGVQTHRNSCHITGKCSSSIQDCSLVFVGNAGAILNCTVDDSSISYVKYGVKCCPRK